MACFWCVFWARPRVGDTLLVQIDVAVAGMMKQRLLGTPAGFQVQQLCGSHRSDISAGTLMLCKEKAENGSKHSLNLAS